MNVAQETLGFRRAGLSPALSLLMSAFALPIPPGPLAGAPSQAYGTLSYRFRDQRSGIRNRIKARSLPNLAASSRRLRIRPVAAATRFDPYIPNQAHIAAKPAFRRLTRYPS